MSVVFPINPDDRFEEYTATAGQTVFAVPFPFQDDRDLTWIKIAAADGAVTTLALTTHYTLSGAGTPGPGSMTLVTAAAAGDKFRVIGTAVLERLTSIVRNGIYSSLALDDEHDRHRIIQNELAREAARAIKADYGQTGWDVDISAFTTGQTLMLGADGKLVPGPDAADIVAAEGYASDLATAVTAAETAAGDAQTASDAAVAAAASFNLPSIGTGDAGKMVIVNEAEDSIAIAATGKYDFSGNKWDLSEPLHGPAVNVTDTTGNNSASSPTSPLVSLGGAWVEKSLMVGHSPVDNTGVRVLSNNINALTQADAYGNNSNIAYYDNADTLMLGATQDYRTQIMTLTPINLFKRHLHFDFNKAALDPGVTVGSLGSGGYTQDFLPNSIVRWITGTSAAGDGMLAQFVKDGCITTIERATLVYFVLQTSANADIDLQFGLKHASNSSRIMFRYAATGSATQFTCTTQDDSGSNYLHTDTDVTDATFRRVFMLRFPNGYSTAPNGPVEFYIGDSNNELVLKATHAVNHASLPPTSNLLFPFVQFRSNGAVVARSLLLDTCYYIAEW